MEIAFDAKRIFHNGTGLGNYSRTLVHNLSRMYPEHNLHLCTPELSDHAYALPFCEPPFNHLIPQGNTPGSWWRTMGMAKDLANSGIQLFHGLSNELPSGLASKKIASVVSIHDLLFLDFPGDYKWMDRQIYKHKFSKACERADKVIAISQATKEKIINYFQTPEEKVEVIYQAVNPFFAAESPEVLKTTVRSKWDLHYGFILFVSALSPRKNILGVLKALRMMKKPPTLVAVGQGSNKEAREYATKHNLPVVFTGSISNAELRALYQQCDLFIYPSLGEGFGIPVIEAMMSRAPVITSKISSMPEAAGDAAYLVDPYDSEDISHAIQLMLDKPELRDEFVQRGLEQIKNFTIEKCTEPVLKVYEQLVGNSEMKLVAV